MDSSKTKATAVIKTGNKTAAPMTLAPRSKGADWIWYAYVQMEVDMFVHTNISTPQLSAQ